MVKCADCGKETSEDSVVYCDMYGRARNFGEKERILELQSLPVGSSPPELNDPVSSE